MFISTSISGFSQAETFVKVYHQRWIQNMPHRNHELFDWAVTLLQWAKKEKHVVALCFVEEWWNKNIVVVNAHVLWTQHGICLWVDYLVYEIALSLSCTSLIFSKSSMLIIGYSATSAFKWRTFFSYDTMLEMYSRFYLNVSHGCLGNVAHKSLE